MRKLTAATSGYMLCNFSPFLLRAIHFLSHHLSFLFPSYAPFPLYFPSQSDRNLPLPSFFHSCSRPHPDSFPLPSTQDDRALRMPARTLFYGWRGRPGGEWWLARHDLGDWSPFFLLHHYKHIVLHSIPSFYFSLVYQYLLPCNFPFLSFRAINYFFPFFSPNSLFFYF